MPRLLADGTYEITSAEFDADVRAAYELSTTAPVAIVDADGKVRMRIGVPRLRDDECCAQARAEGAAEERRKIVAYLQQRAETDETMGMVWGTLVSHAHNVERGEHEQKP